MNDDVDQAHDSWQALPTRRSVLSAGTIAASLIAMPSLAAPPSPIVRTRSGPVRGAAEGGVLVFRGIPYAAPTGGARRFRPPAPPAVRQTVREGNAFGDRCPQLAAPPTGAFASWTAPTAQSEDCLSLNVWTGSTSAAARRPVMVWIHGGGFAVGSGATNVNDGARLARKRDVVVVTVNHRLNLFGYLYLGDIAPEFRTMANPGQLDLVAALTWVRDNIAAFGGDPGNVTIFGESGGGSKVAALLAMPSAAGLYHRAILQSGYGRVLQSTEQATAIARNLLRALGLSPNDTSALERIGVEPLLAALRQITNGNPTLGPGIVLDGTVVPEAPFAARVPPAAAGVPLIVGHNATETTVLFPPAGAFAFDWGGATKALRKQARAPEKLIAGFRALHPAASPSEIYFAITTAAGMASNARNVADKMAASGADVFAYRLDWRTPAAGGRLGAPHALDLPLVFDTVATSPSIIGGAEDKAQQVAEAMSGAWAAFARTGSPNGPGLAPWPKYDLAHRRTMLFDRTSRAAADPDGAEQQLIAALA